MSANQRQRGSLKPLSMPACAEINSSMQQHTNVKYSTSEKHKETTYARVERCTGSDTYLQRSPFTAETSLRNIATGVTAPPHVNVHKSKSIGNHILASMEGNPVASYIFRKKDQAVTMDTKSTIKIQDLPPASLSEVADGWYEKSRVTECLRSRTLSLSLALQFDQPQNPVWLMLCSVLRL